MVASKLSLTRAVLWLLLPEILLLPLMFVLVKTGSFGLATLGMAIATFPHAMFCAALAGILSQVFPTGVRYTANSLAYQLCTTVFAGTAPLMSQFLLTSTGSIWPVVALGLAYVVISLVCTTALIRRSSWSPSAATKKAVPARSGEEKRQR
ncbi:hypothetical protein [Saccharopolyspora phatthalungensis]|uniref:Uncharacterized protein n=1 Tax=Saccharopolyspora phatthalungensis TaxID=664693 RepID=A0A840QBF0_9PSEU|nr:hypothetical protein [Saccharopolyspora phatthalungensis]MBB5157130.1 hypothetical protein [Saccharopolyspora phatthalungensis]